MAEDDGWSPYPNGEAEVVFKQPDGTFKTVRFQRNPIGLIWKKGVIGSSHVYVGKVAEESHAKMFGIQEGWRIMRVNGTDASLLSRKKLNHLLYERTKQLPEAPVELSLLLAPGQDMPTWGPPPSKQNTSPSRSQFNTGSNRNSNRSDAEAATGGGEFNAFADHVERNFKDPLPITSLQATLVELKAKKRLLAGDVPHEGSDDEFDGGPQSNFDSLEGLRTALYDLKSNGRNNVPRESRNEPEAAQREDSGQDVPELLAPAGRREEVRPDPQLRAPPQAAQVTTAPVANAGPGDEMWGTSGSEIARSIVGEAVTLEVKPSDQTIESTSSAPRGRAKAKVKQPEGLAAFYQRATWLGGGGCHCALDEMFNGCNPRADKEPDTT